MADRRYNGQLYQSATTEVRFTTDDGFDFKFNTWEDLKLEYGADGKVVNNSDGSIGGWVSDVVKTAGNLKIRLDEWYAFEEAVAAQYPDLGALQIVFNVSVAYGNVISRLKKDTAKVKINKAVRDAPKSQDALMADMPLLVLDFQSNGRAPIQFPM